MSTDVFSRLARRRRRSQETQTERDFLRQTRRFKDPSALCDENVYVGWLRTDFVMSSPCPFFRKIKSRIV